MIRLVQIPSPAALTPQLIQQLTQEFIADNKKVVWKGNRIEETLLKMSHNKCCYCECNVSEESKYLEVEHFQHKDKYQSLVLDWFNLLPSCKRCNTTKNDHDVVLEPIIKPTQDSPQAHLCIRDYRLYPKTDLGKKTIEIIKLNDRERLVKPRFDLGDKLKEELEELLELSTDYDNGKSQHTRRKNIITTKLERLMREAIPTSEYAATMASVLLHDDSYKATKTIFQKHNLWTTEFQDLELQAQSCALDLK